MLEDGHLTVEAKSITAASWERASPHRHSMAVPPFLLFHLVAGVVLSDSSNLREAPCAQQRACAAFLARGLKRSWEKLPRLGGGLIHLVMVLWQRR